MRNDLDILVDEREATKARQLVDSVANMNNRRIAAEAADDDGVALKKVFMFSLPVFV